MSADDSDTLLSVSDTVKADQCCQGVSLIAAAASDVLITGLSLYGTVTEAPIRLKVYVSHSRQWIKEHGNRTGAACWDWRSYTLAADHAEISLSLDRPNMIPL